MARIDPDDVLEATERFATSEGFTAGQVRDSVCDLFGFTPDEDETALALLSLESRELVRTDGVRWYLTALDDEEWS